MSAEGASLLDWMRDLAGRAPLDGGYRLLRGAAAERGVRLTFARPRSPALRLLVTPRDDAAPRAAATRHWNIVCTSVEGGTLARPAERAYHDFIARLRSAEAPPVRARRPGLASSTRLLIEGLAALAAVSPNDPWWRTLATWITSRTATERHARAIRSGALGFDLALSARGNAWRAGITINSRAVPDLARRTETIVEPLHVAAVTAALSLAALRRLELTVGVAADATGSKLKVYAQETRYGSSPIDRATLAAVALFTDVAPGDLPPRAAVACVDLPAGGPPALKVYTRDPPRARGAAAFAADARRAGGNVYFTRRFASGRSRLAANAVFRAHRPRLRARSLAFARSLLPSSVATLLHLAADSPIAITALGLDLDGPEADVYFTPIPL